MFEIKISIDVKVVKLIFSKSLLESKDEISVLPVLHLLVFLFQKMFLLLVILFVIKLYVRNNTFKLKIAILPSKDNFLICHSFITLHIILTVLQKLNSSSFFLLYHIFLHITPKIFILSLVSLIFVI